MFRFGRYWINAERTRQVPDEDAQNTIPTKDGVWFGPAGTRLINMRHLTTLAGGQRGDGRFDWPEAQDGTPSFVKTGPEDAAKDSELDALFDVIQVYISLLKLKLYIY